MGRRRGRRDPRHRSGLRKQRRGSKWQGVKNLVVVVGFVIVMTGVILGGGGASDSPDAPADTDIEDDADRDRIPDSWERSGEAPDGSQIPSADPGQFDLYIQVVTAENVQPLTHKEQAQLRTIWAEMPVGPNGGGIDLHFIGAHQLDEPVTIEGSSSDFDQLKSEYYDQVAPEACVYQTVMLVDVTSDEVAGRGHSPGYFLFADGVRRETGSVYSYRVSTITHELLHNVVGEIGGGIHTTEGWLSTGYDTYLSQQTSDKLNSTGFAVPEGYDGCEIP